MENIEIVTLQRTEWQQYRDLRLRALKEEPQAYASTYRENADKPDSYWTERLDEASSGQTQWLVFAKQGDNLVGMVGAFMKDHTDIVDIIAVYVAKEARGKGIAKKLMNAIMVKIKENKQVRKMRVGVNPEQVPALNLYKSLGFIITKKEKMILGDGKEHDSYDMEKVVDDE
jgi:ribosomal protein S18 acetylase RimI-like enzyme